MLILKRHKEAIYLILVVNLFKDIFEKDEVLSITVIELKIRNAFRDIELQIVLNNMAEDVRHWYKSVEF